MTHRIPSWTGAEDTGDRPARPGGLPNALARWAATAVLVLAGSVSPAFAQRLDLTVTPKAITFPASDPDAVPLISAAPVQIDYRVRQIQGNQSWTLTVIANGDLASGPSTVDISNVSWVATPAPPLRNGTLSRTVAQLLASGTGTINPTAHGQITFRLVNAWTYDAGIYTQTLTFTLTTP
jgi:hypothetical protein